MPLSSLMLITVACGARPRNVAQDAKRRAWAGSKAPEGVSEGSGGRQLPSQLSAGRSGRGTPACVNSKPRGWVCYGLGWYIRRIIAGASGSRPDHRPRSSTERLVSGCELRGTGDCKGPLETSELCWPVEDQLYCTKYGSLVWVGRWRGALIRRTERDQPTNAGNPVPGNSDGAVAPHRPNPVPLAARGRSAPTPLQRKTVFKRVFVGET
jgi:hypothetical protein